MIALAHTVFRLMADLLGLVGLSFKPRHSLEAENLFLRRQLALYKERGVKPRRIGTVKFSETASILALKVGQGTPRVVNPKLFPGRMQWCKRH